MNKDENKFIQYTQQCFTQFFQLRIDFCWNILSSIVENDISNDPNSMFFIVTKV